MVGLRGCRVHILRSSPNASALMDIRATGKKKQWKTPAFLYEQSLIIKAAGWRSGKCPSHLSGVLNQGPPMHILAQETRDPEAMGMMETALVIAEEHGSTQGSAGREGSPGVPWASPPTSCFPRCLGTPDATTTSTGSNGNGDLLPTGRKGEEVVIMVHRGVFK